MRGKVLGTVKGGSRQRDQLLLLEIQRKSIIKFLVENHRVFCYLFVVV